MPELSIEEINQLCKDVAEVTLADEVAQNMAALNEEEEELLALIKEWNSMELDN